MGVRELMNEHKTASSAVIGVLIVICLVWILRQSGAGAGTASLVDQRYYTDDNGKTYFSDDRLKITPFTRNGKEAVRAHVYKCGDEEPTVHYMERYTEVGRKAAAESLTKTGGKDIEIPDALMGTAFEFKRPEDAAWQPLSPGPKKCPDGSPPQWIEP